MGRKAGVLLVLSLAFAAGAIAVAALDGPNDLSTSPPVTAIEEAPVDATTIPAVERLVSDQPPRHLYGFAASTEPTPPSTVTPLAASKVASAVATTPLTTLAPIATTPPTTVAPVGPLPPDTLAPITTAPPTTVAPVGPLPADTGTADRFVSDINSLRASLGVAPLVRSGDLDARALEWSRVMASDGVLRHSGVIHSLVSESWMTAAENVGYGPNEQVVFAALTVSAGHYLNMVNADFTHVGIASVLAGGTLWTTHIFTG